MLNQHYTRIKELESQVVKWKQDFENCSKLEKNLTKEHQYCLDNWRACEKKQQLKQSQNQKDIEVLIDLKDFNYHCVFGNFKIENYINNKIKELRKNHGRIYKK